MNNAKDRNGRKWRWVGGGRTVGASVPSFFPNMAGLFTGECLEERFYETACMLNVDCGGLGGRRLRVIY